MKRTAIFFALFTVVMGVVAGIIAGCDDAATASHNLSYDADNFKINRRVVFYNGITGEWILSIEGRCSIKVDTMDHQLEVVMKTSETTYKKHFLGLSDNVTYFVEQLDPAEESAYHCKILFKPTAILPSLEVR